MNLSKVNIVLGFFFNLAFVLAAQSQSSITLDSKNLSTLYPSPTAAELGKYGEINIGLSTGAMQYSIPIYNLQNRQLNLPVSINYLSNGLKVDQLASNVGLSWSLNAGGVITRTIVGEDDFFNPSAHALPPRTLESTASFNNPDQALLNFLDVTAASQTSQPDVFYFNFGKYSGKFVFDYAGKPALIPYQNLKIVIGTNGVGVTGHNFTITTPDGVTYFFDKVEWTRYSKEGANCNGQSTDTRRETSWYLSSIKHPNGDTINLLYSAISYTYKSSIDQTISVASTTPQPVCGSSSAFQAQPKISTCTNLSSVDGWQLSEINSSHGISLHLSNGERTDIPGSKKIESIILKASNKTMKSFHFTYLTNGERMFLTAVEERSPDGETKKHAFTYKRINSLPKRLSFSQDKYGFYNGKNNSSNFFTPQYAVHPYFNINFADRSSDGTTSQYGSLDTIIYPSGGKSVISYESHQTERTATESVMDEFFHSVSAWGGTASNPIYGTNTQELIFTTPNFSNSSTIQASFKALVRNYGPDTPDPYNRTISFELYNLTSGYYVTGRVVSGVVTFPTSIRSSLRLFNDYSTLDNQIEYECSISSNTQYRLRVTSTGNDVMATISLSGSYYTGQTKEITEKVDYGGTRVKSIITYDNGVIIKQKRYTYNSLDNLKNGITESSMHAIGSFINYQSLVQKVWCPNVDCGYGNYVYDQLSSTYINIGLGSSHVYYEAVIEHEDVGFLNGGTEHHFICANDEMGRTIIDGDFPQRLVTPLTNRGYMNGTEIYTRVFKQENGIYQNIKETFTNYFIDPINNAKDVRGFIVKKDALPCIGELQSDLRQYTVGIFDYISRWYYVNDVRNLTYTPEGIVEERIFYEYHNPKHGLVNKIIRSKSDGNNEITYTLYPNDYAVGTSFIEDMKANYLIAYPIEEVRYSEIGANREILKGKLTTYKTGGKALIEQIFELDIATPISLASFKFSNNASGKIPFGDTGAVMFAGYLGYEPKLIYSNYDSNGNPRQIEVPNQTSTTYIWSYNGQYPVAEIKNAYFTTTQSILGGSTALDNFSKSYPTDIEIHNKLGNVQKMLPQSLVRYFTYDIINGMTSMTDSRGITEYYQYDGFQRLKDVLDFENNVLKDYRYHYRP